MSDPTNPWAEQPDDFSDLDNFGGDYKPEQSFRSGIDTLHDGPYEFEVVSAILDRTSNTADRVCRIGLKVVNGCRVVEWTHFLSKVQGVNHFAADLAALGFDANRWNTPQRPLSKEIPAAVAKLPGIKFRAMKISRKDGRPGVDKTYHDLQIHSRIDGRPMPTLSPLAAAVQTPPPSSRPVGAGTSTPNGMQPAPAPAVGVGVPGSDSIPF